jgi:Zn-dependent protease
LFGGATRARVKSRGPGDEFLIAAVGPLISLLVAALFWAVDVFARDALPRSLIGMFGYLAWVNLLLAVFNLVPGFPLDGGRLLRSLVWRATGSFRRATRIASLAGQAVGWLLVAGGVAFLLTGNLAGGIWFAFIGWFLVQAARASYQELQSTCMVCAQCLALLLRYWDIGQQGVWGDLVAAERAALSRRI